MMHRSIADDLYTWETNHQRNACAPSTLGVALSRPETHDRIATMLLTLWYASSEICCDVPSLAACITSQTESLVLFAVAEACQPEIEPSLSSGEVENSLSSAAALSRS